jgi:signal transduction histidine kinase
VTTRAEILDFRLLFEGSPDILLVLLPDAPHFTMVAATDARLAATHTTRDTLGKPLFEIFPDNPDDSAASGTDNLRASLERVLSTRAADTMAVQKYDIRGPDGSFQTKYWSPKNIPLLSASGEVLYILHRVEDVTDLVQASEVGEELRDRTRQMEREVITRSRELADANRSLRDANERLGELDVTKTAFFSNVSHEFRTPLTLILGPVERAVANPEATLAGADLAAVHRNALRLLRLVNSLLDFSRIESRNVVASYAPTDLGAFTAGLAGAFQSLFEEAGLEFVIDCPPLPEPVYVDHAHWEKVVMNLVQNAFKFTFEGVVSVRQRWLGDRVELSVSDTGTGIPEAELPRLFERFHRVAGASGRSFEGSGIGLALVHELVRLHGGEVRVQSEVGRGTTFFVEIPTGTGHLPSDRITLGEAFTPSGITKRVTPSGVTKRVTPETPGAAAGHVLEAKQWSGASEPRPSTPTPLETTTLQATAVESNATAESSARQRVLVADDNADMREYLQRLLAPYWEIQTVANGRAALSAALAAPPDLVLSDVMMPELDGVSLLAALRADPRTKTVPVILISARAGEEARLAGLETGVDDYLVKPFAAREVVTRVRTHLEIARVRREAYRELQQTQGQLIQAAKMASLGELVAGVAHEINNPLAFTLAHMTTVERALATIEASGTPDSALAPLWQRANSRLREVQLGLSRIQELVLKLRTFSRLDEGERKRVSVRESVESALTILQHRIGPRLSIATQFGEPDGIDCYASLLNQAVMNLIGNAIDAIDGPGSITIETGAHDGWFQLVVEDTGCGIPQEVRDRVFEPFFTTKAVGAGTGLGLSITYSIAKKHGGNVELIPREGGGTRAVFRFPINAPSRS